MTLESYPIDLESYPTGALYRNGVGQSEESVDGDGEGTGVPRRGVELDDKMERFFWVRFMLDLIRVWRDTHTLMGSVQSE